MSRRHRPRPSSHSYRELIATVQESTCDLIENQQKRDQDRFSYEKYKLVLLGFIVLTLWIMFFLLWGKLDDGGPADSVPAPEHHSAPRFPLPPYEEPISFRYA